VTCLEKLCKQYLVRDLGGLLSKEYGELSRTLVSWGAPRKCDHPVSHRDRSKQIGGHCLTLSPAQNSKVLPAAMRGSQNYLEFDNTRGIVRGGRDSPISHFTKEQLLFPAYSNLHSELKH
jgi:hypothetical protein